MKEQEIEKQALQIAPKQETRVVNIEDYAMSIDKLVGQVQLIQQVMQKVMKRGEHYGVIPGTKKPTLLKPGAEKLCLTFRLDPHYDIIREVRDYNFIAYTVRCDLTHIPTGQHVASGIGSCNSKEVKYRYRYENTGNQVPNEYWKTRDQSLLGGLDYRPRKVGNTWYIFKEVENDNPWDLDNTIIKMACKRALVAATLNATAASDIFTQDVEDLPAEYLGAISQDDEQVEEREKEETKPATNVQKGNGDSPTQAQRKKLWAMAQERGLTKEEAKEFASWAGIDNKRRASEVIDNFDDLLAKWQEETVGPVDEGEGIPNFTAFRRFSSCRG